MKFPDANCLHMSWEVAVWGVEKNLRMGAGILKTSNDFWVRY
jgi:hypothetical protein